MLSYVQKLRARRNSDEGASAVEYGLLVAAIAAIIVLLVFAIGKGVQAGFKDTCDAFDKQGSAGIKEATNCEGTGGTAP